MSLVAEKGATGIVEFLGTILLREDLLRSAAQAHYVSCRKSPKTLNWRYMVGAPNKSIDCMACELPLLETDLPEWMAMFVVSDYARACDLDDVYSIEAELNWYINHPDDRRRMGRRYADKIRLRWDYDPIIDEVVSILERY
jgi:hypothetical protein